MGKHPLPKGFLAGGIHCGMKKKRKDLALIFSRKRCKVAALFTTNAAKAAPVIHAQRQLARNGGARAVVINSGNANCMTGARGLKDARKTAGMLAELLGLGKEDVLVSSTGIIGQFLPMKILGEGLPRLVESISSKGLADAADGIMTTDSFRKISSRSFDIGGKKVRLTGIAKGAGMVKPDMATMLSYIMTDAEISREALKKALRSASEVSFNAMTVDGDMSTNDTVMLLANGEAGNRKISEKGKDLELFLKNLSALCRDLAKMIVRDGEGASKFIEVRVKGAKKKADAKRIAGSIADSLLVKCAVLGGDPNWGRIASSAGASGVKFDPGRMEITLDGVTFFRDGKVARNVDRKASSVFKKKNVRIEVNLHSGRENAVYYSCDISKKYITLNSFYTT